MSRKKKPLTKRPTKTVRSKSTDRSDGRDRGVPLDLLDQMQSVIQQHLDWEEKQKAWQQTQEQILAKLQALDGFHRIFEQKAESDRQVIGLKSLVTDLHHEKQLWKEKQEGLQQQLEEKQVLIDSLEEKMQVRENSQRSLESELRSASRSLEQAQQDLESERNTVQSLKAALLQQETSEPVQELPSANSQAHQSKPSPGETNPSPETDSWEQQKQALFEKYGGGLPAPETEAQEACAADTSPQPLASDNKFADDHFEVKGLSVSEIDEPELGVTDRQPHSTNESGPEQENPSEAVDEQSKEIQRRRELELALERARISRQRRLLEEKMLAVHAANQAEKSEANAKKSNLLTRMTQFLKRDEKSKGDERFENLVNSSSQPSYADPRDHPMLASGGDTELKPDWQTDSTDEHPKGPETPSRKADGDPKPTRPDDVLSTERQSDSASHNDTSKTDDSSQNEQETNDDSNATRSGNSRKRRGRGKRRK